MMASKTVVQRAGCTPLGALPHQQIGITPNLHEIFDEIDSRLAYAETAHELAWEILCEQEGSDVDGDMQRLFFMLRAMRSDVEGVQQLVTQVGIACGVRRLEAAHG